MLPAKQPGTASANNAARPSLAISPGTVRALFDHYEEMGDFVIRNLAEEGQGPRR